MDSSGSQEKKGIPRFASFKPRPPPPPDNDRPAELSSRERAERDEKSRNRSKHRSSYRRHRGHRSRSREHRSDRRESRRARKESGHDKNVSPEPSPPSGSTVKDIEDSADLYVVDRKGDKYVLIYGTVHRYSVPNYYRIGRGRVLGLPPDYRIDRTSVGENELVIRSETSRADSSKARKKRLLSRSDKSPPRLLRVRPTSFVNDPIKSSEDFVPLKFSRRRRHEGGVQESDSENEQYGYRSIHGKLKPDERLPSDVELVSETESDDEGTRQDPDADIKQRNVYLSRNVEQRPDDVEAWLELIDHQETVLRGSVKPTSALTSAEQNSLADIKLSIYEKALKKIGQGVGRDRLLIGLLEEGAKLWDTKKLLAQWHSTLKANPQYIGLWVRYLDFRQTEFLNFTHGWCLSTFIECLSMNNVSPDSSEKVRVQMYLFLRLTLFLREAGYTEQAVGLWQAILELTFFRPPGLDINANADQVLSAFADFWDSEVARIGETRAKGWRNSSGALLDPKIFVPQSHLDSEVLLASWSACEGERMLNAQLPARSLDEPEDDPYRVVLASDLREFLPLASLPNSTSEVLDSFLYFCQLPPIITVDSLKSTGPWMGDSFLRNELAAVSYAKLDDWLPTSTASSDSGVSVPTIFSHQRFVHSADTYFADPKSWFFSFAAWEKDTSDPASGVYRDWVRRTLRLLVEVMPQKEDLAEYSVAVESVCSYQEAKKYAKSLLKKRSSSLRLYNSYALMERRTGNYAAADHVWATAISMSKSLSDAQRMESVLLWHTWIWEMLNAQSTFLAVQLLTCMPQNSIDPKSLALASSPPEFSPANLLKIRSCLMETQESGIAAGKPTIVTACTDLRAILLYLSQGQDLGKSLEAYSSTINRIESLPNSAESFKSYTTELLHQSRARLLYYHLRTSTLYKPSYFRGILAESITLYPHNTIFLSLFAWNESRFRIEERVRDVMRDLTRSRPSSSSSQTPITTHLFSIYTELNRPTYAGSTLHSVRAAFERAIGEQDATTSNNTSSARSSISLWKLYILFELSRNDITRAKAVFFRAMRACPWSKDILMLAFSHLREDVTQNQGDGKTSSMPVRKGRGLNFHELRNVYNVLVEKELRIHVDIERDLDELAARMEQNAAPEMQAPIAMPNDVDNGSGDEEMHM
ncbi:NRDE-2, necessary for RNA interference-domain-containing protein [Aspergillus egyptiacus]|nr:NRDE-2, necessary for RNA interference-domain-containing protein [Aspergillus egyptiacus]